MTQRGDRTTLRCESKKGGAKNAVWMFCDKADAALPK